MEHSMAERLAELAERKDQALHAGSEKLSSATTPRAR
jgi:hypothetical protein